MKAVLCLWDREHLKGRPGPGSGLARLLKKKRKHNTLAHTEESCGLLCMCVFVCLAKSSKQDGCLATLGRDTPRKQAGMSMLREMREERMVWLKATDLLSPVVLLQVHPVGPQSGVQHLRGGVWRRDEDEKDVRPARTSLVSVLGEEDLTTDGWHVV